MTVSRDSWRASLALVLLSVLFAATVRADSPIPTVADADPQVPTVLLEPTGENSGDFFGIAVSGAGDVNGDGHADFVVGAPGYGPATGRAYVFFGGPAADLLPDVTLSGTTPWEYFGASVSGVGDINGDGFDDVAIGTDSESGDPYRVYVFFGGLIPDPVVDLVLTGVGWDRFGYSVAGAGDVNGDGFDDLVVGAFNYYVAGLPRGRAYVYLGGASGDTTADMTFTSDETFGIGVSVAGAGDVDADGFADVIVGASDRAFVFHGGATLDSIPDRTFSEAGDGFGISVSGAGDCNGDGYADMIVGAPNGDVGGENIGQAYLFLGGPVVDEVFDRVYSGVAEDDRFGWVSGAGDVNGDSYPDVVIGAYGTGGDHTSNYIGTAYVFHGGPSADNVADMTLEGEIVGEWFGYAASGAGDVNGDGLDDVIVGGFRTGHGRAVVYDSRSPVASADRPASLALALEAVAPNPIVGHALVRFTLPSAAPASVDLIDISGRRVWSRAVGRLGPGRHTVAVVAGQPGIYFVRLDQGGQTRSRKVAVVE